ncbi:MAG TPA: nuclear transport factor 2 family protein [Vicinamibacterales bacterium]
MRGLMLVRAAALAAVLGVVAPARTFAQPPDHKAIQEAIEAFLLHLGDGEFDKVAADLAAKAMVIVVRQRDGKFVNSYETGDAWVASLKRNANFSKFREPITNVKVTVDSDALAYLRADFQVVRDGKTLSHGVDQFTLVREDGRWKIAAVAYTSIAGM